MGNPASSFSVLHHVVTLRAPTRCAEAVDVRRVDTEYSKRFGLLYHRIAHRALDVCEGHSRFAFRTFMASPWMSTDSFDRLTRPSLGIWEPHHSPGRDRRVTKEHNVRIAFVFVPKIDPTLPPVAGIASWLGPRAFSRHLPMHPFAEVVQPLPVRASSYSFPWRSAIGTLYESGESKSDMSHQP